MNDSENSNTSWNILRTPPPLRWYSSSKCQRFPRALHGMDPHGSLALLQVSFHSGASYSKASTVLYEMLF